MSVIIEHYFSYYSLSIQTVSLFIPSFQLDSLDEKSTILIISLLENVTSIWLLHVKSFIVSLYDLITL